MTPKSDSPSLSIKVGPLRRGELEEADGIMRLAFGTFLGLPNPAAFLGDRCFLRPRWDAPHVKVIGARLGGRLIGTNVVTRWGAFGFFGPLTVLPEFWDRGVAQRLLAATQRIFDGWGVRRTGLFTFAQSAKHVGLYQKFGYWPGYLTAIMTRTPAPGAAPAPVLLSAQARGQREAVVRDCARLTAAIAPGLDLGDEIRATLAGRGGDVVLSYGRRLDGFAVCLTGVGSEGGTKTCYVKFGAARGGPGVGARFEKLLDAVEAFAAARATQVEAGVNLAREPAFRRLRARGYRVGTQGVAMQRPHRAGYNRPGAFVMDDWR